MIKREVERIGCKLASHGRGQIVCEQVGWSFPFTDHNSARGWSCVINRRGRTSYRLHRGLKDIEGVRVRGTGTATASRRTRSMCIESENTATHSLLGVNGEAADDLHRRRQVSDLEDASSDRADTAAETGMDKVLVSLDTGAVAAVTGQNEFTVCTVQVGCQRFEMWRFCVCSLKCQNETAEITLLNTVDRTRRVKTIPRNTTRYSHDSLGHCESSIKEVEKQIRVFIPHTWRADNKCDSDRHVAWTITQCTVNAEEQNVIIEVDEQELPR